MFLSVAEGEYETQFEVSFDDWGAILKCEHSGHRWG